MSSEPAILTTTVGSYPVPDWLPALPSEQARLDATRVVFDTQRQARIDLPTDGELYRFDVNHPDTNGMIEYFIRPMAGIRSQVGRSDHECFRAQEHHEVPAQGRGCGGAGARRRLAQSAGRLRTRRRRRGRAVQVHGHQPLHAGAHPARQPLPGFRRAADGDRGRSGAAGGRAALRLPAGGRGEHSGQSRRRSAGCRSHQLRAGCLSRQARRASVFRQLRRADHSEGRVARPGELPQSAARGSPGARNGAPPAGRSGAAEGGGSEDPDRHRRDRREGQSRGDARRKSRAPSSAPKVSWAPDAWAGSIPIAASGCSSAPIADRKIAALAAGRDLYLGRA